MSEVWTHGPWTGTLGRECDFVGRWETNYTTRPSTSPAGVRRFGDWTVKASLATRTFLRDTERSNVVISFGPWPGRETAAR